MKDVISHGQRAQTQLRAAREAQPLSLSERLGFSPKEFGEANGRSATWAYRQVYAGKVKVISDGVRMIIPRSEIDGFLARASEYSPQPKAKSSTTENGAAK